MMRPLVEVMASEQNVHPDLWEDAVQEGLIRAWQTSVSHPDEPPAYVYKAARRAVGNVARGRSFTGAPSRQGRQEPLDSSAEWPDEGAWEPFVFHAPFDRVEELADAPIREVREAVGQLPAKDRWLVHLRFEKDLTWPEVSEHMSSLGRGTGANALRTRFTKHIAPQLRKALTDE